MPRWARSAPLLLRGISGLASAFQALVGATASTSAARGMQRSGWPWNCSPAAKADSLVGEGAFGGDRAEYLSTGFLEPRQTAANSRQLQPGPLLSLDSRQNCPHHHNSPSKLPSPASSPALAHRHHLARPVRFLPPFCYVSGLCRSILPCSPSLATAQSRQPDASKRSNPAARSAIRRPAVSLRSRGLVPSLLS